MKYSILALAFILAGAAIVGKAAITYFVHGSKWQEIAQKNKGSDISIVPRRGNIYSTDYELMATTEDRYRIYLDFWGNNVEKMLTPGLIDTLTMEMKTILPDSAVKYFNRRIKSGLEMRKKYETLVAGGEDVTEARKKSGYNRKYRIINQDVNYMQLKQIKELPFFETGKVNIYNTGLIAEPLVSRINPYGSLASRTIGGVYANTEVDGKIGRSGLEFQYDSLLRGTPGWGKTQRLNGQEVKIIDIEPVEGKDIVSTIDVDLQDLAEKALVSKLDELNAESGTAIVMEVATGHVKAIANMAKNSRGEWYEQQNFGLSYSMEPGSTFKVVSMMIGLDHGLIRPEDPVDVGNGYIPEWGGMYDHNYNRGGYGLIDASLSIRYSSNIGVAKLIHKAYRDNPQRYLDGIDSIGAFQDLQLEIPGYGIPRIRRMDDRGWSNKLSLVKMSYGYENTIPPISTLAFFNAIANNGELVKPLFVKEILQNGKLIEKRDKVVLNPRICKVETLKHIRQMLDDVVNGEKGTGSPVRSAFVPIAGKTGTAQILLPGGTVAGHQVSFCGYFPVSNPKYSCIVVIRRPRAGEPSGGRMAGAVFKQIAEGMYSRNFLSRVDILPVDTLNRLMPVVKPVLAELELTEGQVPDVKGMGARDAVYALEKIGLDVSISGRGAVTSQSIKAGTKYKPGDKISLVLK